MRLSEIMMLENKTDRLIAYNRWVEAQSQRHLASSGLLTYEELRRAEQHKKVDAVADMKRRMGRLIGEKVEALIEVRSRRVSWAPGCAAPEEKVFRFEYVLVPVTEI